MRRGLNGGEGGGAGRLRPTCQDHDVGLLQGSTTVLPDVEGVAAAQQPPRHPPEEAGDAQGLHGSPGGPGRTGEHGQGPASAPQAPSGRENMTVRPGLRLLTEAFRRVLGAAGPGSPAE